MFTILLKLTAIAVNLDCVDVPPGLFLKTTYMLDLMKSVLLLAYYTNTILHLLLT